MNNGLLSLLYGLKDHCNVGHENSCVLTREEVCVLIDKANEIVARAHRLEAENARLQDELEAVFEDTRQRYEEARND